MLIAYYFYWVNGVYLYVQVVTECKPNTHNVKVSLMDMNRTSHPEFCGSQHQPAEDIEKPNGFELMKEISSALAGKSPCVFCKPVYGELTFTLGFDTVNIRFENS